jgi:predicted regulator of Ras-like GTPase activity (Roadblock/LC7/MglB family)
MTGARSDPSIVNDLRERVPELIASHALVGGLIAGPDGFVIAANLPSGVAAEPLAALGSALGRQLELVTEQLGGGTPDTAHFSSNDGTLFVGTTRVGFVLLLGDRNVNVAAVRKSLQEVLRALSDTWADSPAAALKRSPSPLNPPRP